MSGGSFNYLYRNEYPGNEYYAEQLGAMAKTLFEMGHEATAREFERKHQELKYFELCMSVWHARMEEVMQAVEWKVSGDWGEEAIQEAIDRLTKPKEGKDD